MAVLAFGAASSCRPAPGVERPSSPAAREVAPAPAEGAGVLVEEPRARPEDLSGAIARDIVRWTNVERLAAGLAPMVWSEVLARAARAHSGEMARLGYFSHLSPDPQNSTPMRRVRNAGLAAPSLMVGENIAKGDWQDSRARRAVRAWMESQKHRENLMRPAFRFIGVGVAWDGRNYYITQVFGSSG
jgi:uncharacterized protein YkwD